MFRKTTKDKVPFTIFSEKTLCANDLLPTPKATFLLPSQIRSTAIPLSTNLISSSPAGYIRQTSLNFASLWGIRHLYLLNKSRFGSRSFYTQNHHSKFLNSENRYNNKESIDYIFPIILGIVISGLTLSQTNKSTLFAHEKHDSLRENNENLQLLIQACKQGDLDFIKNIKLTNDIYQAAQDDKGNTLLLIAAKYGHLSIVQWLVLQKLATLKERNYDKTTAFLMSCKKGHKELAIWLLKEGGAHIAEQDRRGYTGLLLAIRNGNKDLVEWLLTHGGAALGEKHSEGGNVLMIAAESGHIHLFRYFLEKGVDIAEKSNDDSTPLHAAAACGQVEMVRWLLEKNYYDVNEQRADGQTPLLLVTAEEEEEEKIIKIVGLLLNKGAKITIRDNVGHTPLLHAAKHKNEKTVKFLLEQNLDRQGVIVNEQDNDGKTALHYAVENNHLELVALLLNMNASIHARDSMGNSPLDLIEKNIASKKTYQMNGNPHHKKWKLRTSVPEEKILENKLKILELFFKKLKYEVDKAKLRLNIIEDINQHEKAKDIRSAMDNFRKILSEKLIVTFYTDKAVWDGKVNATTTSFDKFLDIAQMASSVSGEVSTRIAANLAKIYLKGELNEYRKNKRSYIQKFDRKSIAEVSREVAKMLADRYKEQIWELSAEGLDDFCQYFHNKLIKHLRKNYKSNPSNSKLPIKLELFEIMIDPCQGDSIPLELRGKENKETNVTKREFWLSDELISQVGIVIHKKHFENDADIKDINNNDEFYQLIPPSKKYGVCFGNKNDILNKKYSRCLLKFFRCRPPQISELLKYNAKNIDHNKLDEFDTDEFKNTNRNSFNL